MVNDSALAANHDLSASPADVAKLQRYYLARAQT
jgi:hypothetical protein